VLVGKPTGKADAHPGVRQDLDPSAIATEDFSRPRGAAAAITRAGLGILTFERPEPSAAPPRALGKGFAWQTS
jgi:hypothetical protein